MKTPKTKFDPTTLHPLAERGQPSGKITFVHTDDTVRHYTSVVNRLTGDRMSWWESATEGSMPSVGHTVPEVRKVFKTIQAKCKRVIEVVGDLLPLE